MVRVAGDRNSVVQALKNKYNIDYDPGPCNYVEIELDAVNKKIISVTCYAGGLI